ncbi:MAG TPA: ABC transporter permease, partial [Chthoniobacterales bacterium]|nr:ABC transporter permease [Chthoniobacterales bacterium]
MNFREILTMALASVGANKLRSALTMLGITIGVFSVISVMTAIGAMQASIETGLTLFGSNIFQFAKYPVNVRAGGRGQKKYENRRDITYPEAQRYLELMEGNAQEVCMKIFDEGKQAVYNGVKTTPSITIVGTNKGFLAANAYTLAYGRNLNDEDVALSRRVLVVGRAIEQRLFPHESPIGRVIKLAGHTFTIVGVMGERGTAFGMNQDSIAIMPITRLLENFGAANRTVNIATQSFSQLDYNRAFDRGVGAMRIARGLRAEEPNDFEIYTNDSLKSAFV